MQFENTVAATARHLADTALSCSPQQYQSQPSLVKLLLCLAMTDGNSLYGCSNRMTICFAVIMELQVQVGCHHDKHQTAHQAWGTEGHTFSFCMLSCCNWS